MFLRTQTSSFIMLCYQLDVGLFFLKYLNFSLNLELQKVVLIFTILHRCWNFKMTGRIPCSKNITEVLFSIVILTASLSMLILSDRLSWLAVFSWYPEDIYLDFLNCKYSLLDETQDKRSILVAMDQLLLTIITKSEAWTFPVNNVKESKEHILGLLHLHS